MRKQNIFSKTGLPEGFGAVLLVSLLVFALAPYFPGLDVGPFKVPTFGAGTCKVLKILGPALLFLGMLCFTPLFPLQIETSRTARRPLDLHRDRPTALSPARRLPRSALKTRFHVSRVLHTIVAWGMPLFAIGWSIAAISSPASGSVFFVREFLRHHFALAILGTLVVLPIAAVLIGLYMYFALSLFYFQGSPRPIRAPVHANEAGVKQDEMDIQDATLKIERISLSDTRVHCLTERCELVAMRHRAWQAALYFTLTNHESHSVLVTDMHAHLYLEESFLPPKASILNRESVVLYEDNSTMFNKKSYRLEPSEALPIELCFRITCDKPEDSWMSIFGLFFDYMLIAPESHLVRCPSDSIFIFQNSHNGHLVYVHKNNLSSYWLRHQKSLSGLAMCNKFEKILFRHTSNAFAL